MKLTARQTEILRELARGTPRKAVASDFGVTTKAIDYHWEKIQESIGVRGIVPVTHWAIANRLVPLLFTLLLASCSATKPTAPRTPNLSTLRSYPRPAPTAAIVAAPRLLGPKWDAPTNFNPLTEWFQVWATTNLNQPFTLKSNTTATACVWPVQAQEFYKVRTVNSSGEFSEWATTR